MTGADGFLRSIIGYNVRRANNSVLTALARVLKPFGLSRVPYSALSVIIETPGLRLADLSTVLSIDRPNMVLILNDLERDGLITRTRSTEDRRAFQIHATQKGMRLGIEANAAVKIFDADITAGMTNDERQQVRRLLQEVEKNANSLGANDDRNTISST